MIRSLSSSSSLFQQSRSLLAGQHALLSLPRLARQHSQRASAAAAAAGSSTSRSSSSPPAGSYRIAVPSYDRVDTLQRNTLPSLDSVGIDVATQVDLFVATEQEAEKFARALPHGSCASIQIGTLGIGKQRNFILDHYRAGAQVVMIDDDVTRFVHMYDGHTLNLYRVIQNGFELSKQHECYMWGLNNASNPFFMHSNYSVGWCFFQGPFMAFRVRDGLRLHPQFHEVKEDVQFSLMHCEHDGKVLRFNGLSVKPKSYFKEPGGLQTSMTSAQRKEAGRVNFEYLAERYGKFIRKWTVNDPHPQMKRSPQHYVRDMPAEELFY